MKLHWELFFAEHRQIGVDGKPTYGCVKEGKIGKEMNFICVVSP